MIFELYALMDHAVEYVVRTDARCAIYAGLYFPMVLFLPRSVRYVGMGDVFIRFVLRHVYCPTIPASRNAGSNTVFIYVTTAGTFAATISATGNEVVIRLFHIPGPVQWNVREPPDASVTYGSKFMLSPVLAHILHELGE